VTGRRPIPLNDAGRAQCRAVVPVIRALAPARIVTSPLVRAYESAAIVAEGLDCPLAVDPDLVEVDFGRWEGCTYGALVGDPDYLAFSRRPLEVAPPGGESLRAVRQRGLAAVARALANGPETRVLLVSHGDLIRALLASFLALDLTELRRLRVDTASLSGVDLTGDWAEVKFVNLVVDPARVWQPLHWGRA
jgi:broad specificity phosphatase PhoE